MIAPDIGTVVYLHYTETAALEPAKKLKGARVVQLTQSRDWQKNDLVNGLSETVDVNIETADR
jgi:hypothetical protein